jgi:hypothetical protein
MRGTNPVRNATAQRSSLRVDGKQGAWNRISEPRSFIAPSNAGRNDVDNFDFVIPVTRCVPGRAVVEGDGPMPQVLTFSYGAPRKSSGVFIAPLVGGRFSIRLPEGEWRMTLATPFYGYTLKSFTYGSVDLLRDPLRLSSTDTAQLRVTVAAGTGGGVVGGVLGAILTDATNGSNACDVSNGLLPPGVR